MGQPPQQMGQPPQQMGQQQQFASLGIPSQAPPMFPAQPQMPGPYGAQQIPQPPPSQFGQYY